MIKTGEKIIVEHYSFKTHQNEEVRGKFVGMIFAEKEEPKIVVDVEGKGSTPVGLDHVNWVRSDEPEVVQITRVRPRPADVAAAAAATTPNGGSAA